MLGILQTGVSVQQQAGKGRKRCVSHARQVGGSKKAVAAETEEGKVSGRRPIIPGPSLLPLL